MFKKNIWGPIGLWLIVNIGFVAVLLSLGIIVREFFA